MSKRVSVCVLLMLTVIGANLGFLNWTWMKHRERMNRITLVTEMRDQALYYGLGEMDGRTKALAEVDEQLIARDDLQNQYLQHVTGKMDRMHDEVLNGIQHLMQDLDMVPELVAHRLPSVVTIHGEHATIIDMRTGEPARMCGSGVVLSEDGCILTAAHVLDNVNFSDCRRLWVRFADGTERDILRAAFTENRDPDVGLVWIDPNGLGLQPITVAEMELVPVLGEQVVVIGSPLRYEHSITVGVVSRHDTMTDLYGTERRQIQIDAAINSGNSGGPVFDMEGKLLGIASWKKHAEGISFAVPVPEILKGIEHCRENVIEVVLAEE